MMEREWIEANQEQWQCAVCNEPAEKFYLCKICRTYVCWDCIDHRRSTRMCIACSKDENLVEILDEMLSEFLDG